MSEGQHWLIRRLEADMHHLTGRHYQIEFEKLDPLELRELVRFMRDVETEMQIRANRARLMPWRRP